MFLVQGRKKIMFYLLFLCSFSTVASDELELSGFATVGVVYSDSENYGYRKSVNSDEGVFKGDIDFKQHSLLGLQADWSISSSLDFVYQGVLRDLPEPSFDRYTTLAFLRYEASPNWSFRIGRTAPDIFLLTEYRDIDFSYAWATAPNEVYGIVPYKSLDGGDITHSYRGFGGVFKTKLFFGESEAEISSSTTIEEVRIEDVVGISLSFDHFDWVFNIKHSEVSIADEFNKNSLLASAIQGIPDFLWPNAHDFSQKMLMKGKNVSYSSLSGQYQWGKWLATAELSRIRSNSDILPTITSGYGALSYQMDNHQFYGIYSAVSSDNYVFNEPGVNIPALGELVHASTTLMNSSAANQQTYALGWRWDLTSNMASSVQWNYTNIEEDGSTLWLSNKQYILPEKVNTFLLTLSMVF